MSGRRGDRLIFAGLILALFLVAVVSFLSTSAREGQADLQGSSLSPAPPGALALYLWLADSGYPVQRIQGATRLADALRDTDVLFVLNPQSGFSATQIADLDAWMNEGGVLVLTIEGTQAALNPLLDHLGASLTPLLPPIAGALPPTQPLWTQPPVRQVGVQTSWQLDLTGATAVPLLGVATGPLAIVQPRGQGRLVLLSTNWPFTNAGLGEYDNRWLAWNLAGSGLGRRVAFDEIHHGYTGGDLRDLVLRSAWGWALIYGGGLVVLGLLFSSRRLGPPLVPRAAGARRGAGEYMTAMAGLFSRAGRTDWVADRYRAELRRALAAPYGLEAGGPAATLAAGFAAAHHHPIDVAELTTLLVELDTAATPGPQGRPVLGDAALLRLIRRAETFRTDAL
ncbi:MAG TPA: DUF4350 domain-containing protein [Chloroflexia bacterium]|nr:DUF4350 domain-containing protein [Chloroflexia bacterium]